MNVKRNFKTALCTLDKHIKNYGVQQFILLADTLGYESYDIVANIEEIYCYLYNAFAGKT